MYCCTAVIADLRREYDKLCRVAQRLNNREEVCVKMTRYILAKSRLRSSLAIKVCGNSGRLGNKLITRKFEVLPVSDSILVEEQLVIYAGR